MTTFRISRDELSRVFSPRAAKQFEQMQDAVVTQGDAIGSNVSATGVLRDATFLTLSANTELPNEYVFRWGAGLRLVTEPGIATLYSDAPRVEGTGTLRFVVPGDTVLALPLMGTLATQAGPETLANKTLVEPKVTGLVNAVDDAAAATAGVPVGGMYLNGSVAMVRVA